MSLKERLERHEQEKRDQARKHAVDYEQKQRLIEERTNQLARQLDSDFRFLGKAYGSLIDPIFLQLARYAIDNNQFGQHAKAMDILKYRLDPRTFLQNNSRTEQYLRIRDVTSMQKWKSKEDYWTEIEIGYASERERYHHAARRIAGAEQSYPGIDLKTQLYIRRVFSWGYQGSQYNSSWKEISITLNNFGQVWALGQPVLDGSTTVTPKDIEEVVFNLITTNKVLRVHESYDPGTGV